MPLLDLTARRFGRLLVLLRAGSVGSQAAWQCQCDCGAIERYPASRLTGPEDKRTTVRACSRCRLQQPCVICGQPFLARHRALCCSRECAAEHERAKRADYDAMRRLSMTPDERSALHRQINASHRGRLAALKQADPVAYAAERERLRVYWAERNAARAIKLAADPAAKASHRAAQREINRRSQAKAALGALTTTGAELARRLDGTDDAS